MTKLAFVMGLLAATSAHAQSFTTGSVNGVPFNAFTSTGGPTGFGAGFASAFMPLSALWLRSFGRKRQEQAGCAARIDRSGKFY